MLNLSDLQKMESTTVKASENWLDSQTFQDWLGGGFKHFLFSPRTLGKMNPFWRSYFSDGLVQPPTSWTIPQFGMLGCHRGCTRCSHRGAMGLRIQKDFWSPVGFLDLGPLGYGCWTKNRVFYRTPQIIHFNRVFHYKPSILGVFPLFFFARCCLGKVFWGFPPIFGSTHICPLNGA